MWSIIQAAGWPIWPLIAASIIALALIFERLYSLRQKVVAPGDPNASRLLMHPLAKEAGGDPFHAGGKHWQSRDDPEFQTLVGWIRGDKAPTSSR